MMKKKKMGDIEFKLVVYELVLFYLDFFNLSIQILLFLRVAKQILD